MKQRRLPLVLFLITNMVSPIQQTFITDLVESRYPVFMGCKENSFCKKRMKASGSFTCIIRDVNSDVRLNVITNSTELTIHFQKETVITTDGRSDVSLQSNFSTRNSLFSCQAEFIVTCKAVNREGSSTQIESTAQLGIIIDCPGERPLSIEEKVWLAAITLFPFLWVFTLVIVCYMNRKNICNHSYRQERSTYSTHNAEKIRQAWVRSTRRMSLTIRPRLVEDVDGEPNDKHIAYVYFIDDRSCYTVSAKAPHKSIKLVLEKKMSLKSRDHIELGVLEKAVQDSSTSERTDDRKNSDDTHKSSTDSIKEDDKHDSWRDSTKELERRESTHGEEMPNEDLEWCRCGKCQEIPDKSKVCCRRTYGECVTNDPLFYQLVTDRNTLQAAMIQWNDEQVASRFEAMAYKEYIYWQMGVTHNYSKVIIPSCVIKKVQARYPNDRCRSYMRLTI